MVVRECATCALELFSRDSGTWASTSTTLLDLEQRQQKLSKTSPVSIVFACAEQIRDCKSCGPRLSKLYSIPPFFWTPCCQRTNGYWGCESKYDAHDNLESHTTSFGFEVKQMLKNVKEGQKDYEWIKVNIFTVTKPSGETQIIILDSPDKYQKRVADSLRDTANFNVFQDPYWIYSTVLEGLIELQDASVWSIRDLVRDMEVSRPSTERPNPDYARLHDIARHAVHSTETLSVAVQTVGGISKSHEAFFASPNDTFQPKVTQSKEEQRAKNRYRSTSDRLDFQSQVLQSLHRRAEAIRERLQAEITLAFNTVAQFDSRVTVQIGRATLADSAAMKTISWASLLFLPATFVSAIFSMGFFNFNPGDADTPPLWTVSSEFWIYWAVAIPFTLLIMLFWQLAQRYFRQQPIGPLVIDVKHGEKERHTQPSDSTFWRRKRREVAQTFGKENV